MTLRIYGIGASRASRPLWLLEELGEPYELVRCDYRDGGTRTAEYLAINPNGHIPTLVDGEIVVWESMAINLYLVRKFGGPLAPATLDHVWHRHFADSAQLLSLRLDRPAALSGQQGGGRPEGEKSWLDLGSGAGFPGLVLAIMLAECAPDAHMTLVESDARVCGK